jgi:hypothetical protein
MTASEERRTKSRLAAKIEEVLGFDLRSLALFRIGLALVVLTDLFIRFGNLTAHYSDVGVTTWKVNHEESSRYGL